MANDIALILITALAVLGAYYLAEIIGAALRPKNARATAVLPWLPGAGDMTGLILCAMASWPGCRVVVLCDDASDREKVPFPSKVIPATREELPALFAPGPEKGGET